MSAETPEERPLRLNDLATIESPEILRDTLRRFRRRTAIRSLWVAGAIIAGLLIIPTLTRSSRDTVLDQFQRGPGESVGAIVDGGPVRVVVIDARRLDKDSYALHIVATTSDLREGEEFIVQQGLSGAIAVSNPDKRGLPPAPPSTFVVASKGRVNEAYVRLEVGTESFSLDFGAFKPLTPEELGSPEAGAPSAPPPGFLGPPAQEGRVIATIQFDLRALGVPEWIWR